MTRAMILNTWMFSQTKTQPQPQPKLPSSTFLPRSNTNPIATNNPINNNSNNNRQRTRTVIKLWKVAVSALLVTMGYYYHTSENLVAKYSNNGSRKYLLARQTSRSISAIMTEEDLLKLIQADKKVGEKNTWSNMGGDRGGGGEGGSGWKKNKKKKKKKKKGWENKVEAVQDDESDYYSKQAAAPAKVSYVHYIGCCGIGHRLARMSNAYHAAQRLQFALRGTWPSCNKRNVFDHLFVWPNVLEDDDEDDLIRHNYTRSGQVVKLRNEVPGYTTVYRAGAPNNRQRRRRQPQPQNTETTRRHDTSSSDASRALCDTCHPDKIASDYEFYSLLLQRFRRQDQVEAFMQQHDFAHHTVIGIHVRAGNGEGGDFESKDRAIENTQTFVQRVSQQVLDLVVHNNNSDKKDNEHQHQHLPPLIFLATDTPTMVDLFREALGQKIPVVVLPQARPSEGQGILFGERKKKRQKQKKQRQLKEDLKLMNRRDAAEEVDMEYRTENGMDIFTERSVLEVQKVKLNDAGDDDDSFLSDDSKQEEDTASETCLQGWDQAFMDIMLLASSDIVIATRRSSFVQTIPLTMVTNKSVAERKQTTTTKYSYCEISEDSNLTMTCHATYMDWCCCEACALRNEDHHDTNGIPKTKKRRQRPIRNNEYVKQLKTELWDVPAFELYQRKMKPLQE
jgi:hypothetical protein